MIRIAICNDLTDQLIAIAEYTKEYIASSTFKVRDTYMDYLFAEEVCEW